MALVLGPVVAIVLVSVALSVVLVTRHVRQILAREHDARGAIATLDRRAPRGSGRLREGRRRRGFRTCA